MSRSRGSAVSCGSLVIGLGRSGVGAPIVERSTAWLCGLMHEAVTIRLTPWRRNWRYGYALAGPALVIGWRR